LEKKKESHSTWVSLSSETYRQRGGTMWGKRNSKGQKIGFQSVGQRLLPTKKHPHQRVDDGTSLGENRGKSSKEEKGGKIRV